MNRWIAAFTTVFCVTIVFILLPTRAELPRANASVVMLMPVSDELTDGRVEFCRKKALADPEGALGYALLAEAYLLRSRERNSDIQDAVDAEKSARRSLKIRPRGNERALLALGRALKTQHRFKQALAVARQAQRQRPDLRSASRLGIDLLIEIGDYPAARNALRQFQPMPGDPADLALTARFALLEGRPEDALKTLEHARDIALRTYGTTAENAAWYHDHVAEIQLALGRVNDAADSYQKAIQLHPGGARGYVALGKQKLTFGLASEAMQFAQAAVALVEAPHTYGLLGDCYRALGEDAKASKAYRMAEKVGDESRRVGIIDDDRLSIQFLADHDRNPGLAYRLAKAEFAQRQDIYTWDAMAWAAYKAGHSSEAQSAIWKALKLGTKDPVLLAHAGFIELHAGQRQNGLAYLRKALAINPWFHPSLAAQAKVSVARG